MSSGLDPDLGPNYFVVSTDFLATSNFLALKCKLGSDIILVFLCEIIFIINSQLNTKSLIIMNIST